MHFLVNFYLMDIKHSVTQNCNYFSTVEWKSCSGHFEAKKKKKVLGLKSFSELKHNILRKDYSKATFKECTCVGTELVCIKAIPPFFFFFLEVLYWINVYLDLQI